MTKQTKILCVCEAGMVRSVAFLTELKWNRDYKDVLNCGVETNSQPTIAMLAKWADVIYVTADRTVWRQLPHLYRVRAVFVDFGKDIWQNPHDPRLKRLAAKKADELGL